MILVFAFGASHLSEVIRNRAKLYQNLLSRQRREIDMKAIPSAPPEPVSVSTADPVVPEESISIPFVDPLIPAEPVPTAEVVAPCDLAGGYLLDVNLNGQVRTVVVVS